MTIIEPVNYEIISTNAIDESLSSWSNGLSVNKGTDYIYKSRKYRAAKSFTSTTPPDDDIDNFVDYGATNSKAFKDEYIHTQTSINGDLHITIRTQENVNSIAFLNCKCSAIEIPNVDLRSANGSIKSWWDYFYSKIGFSTLIRDLKGWWDYFYGGFRFKKDVFLKLPNISGEIKIILRAVDNKAALGLLIVGNTRYLGETLINPEISGISYAKKITDEWGNTFVRKGKTAKRASYMVVIQTARADEIANALHEAQQAGLALFVGDSRQDGIDALTIYGIISEYSLNVTSNDLSELDLTLEGVI